ncbi:MAG: hypothetical protein R2854_15375 [Caldilineaceae bacterium]
MFRLISATCDNDVVGWFVLAAEATNTVQTRRHCEYDLIGRPFGSDEALPVYIGTIVTARWVTLYIPDDGIPDNLLGTPTPAAQAATPTQSPSATASPPNCAHAPPARSSPGTPTRVYRPSPPNQQARTRHVAPACSGGCTRGVAVRAGRDWTTTVCPEFMPDIPCPQPLI